MSGGTDKNASRAGFRAHQTKLYHWAATPVTPTQLVAQHCYLVAIADAENLRGNILRRATHGGQHGARSKELGQAKVSYFDGRLVGSVYHQHVL